MQYTKLKELIDHFEQFGIETGSQDISSFASWLHQRTNHIPVQAEIEPERHVEGKILEEFGKLTNFTKHYVKKAIKDTPLAGWNDLIAMIVLFYSGSRRKTEVIQMGLMELSPGMEVVRRLLRLELIEEFPDPDDGRAKRVQLTDKGRAVFLHVERNMDKVSQIVSGNLTTEERHQLAIISGKLTHFHYPIWEKDFESELDTLIEKYL